MFFSKLFGKKKKKEEAQRPEEQGKEAAPQASGEALRLEELLAQKGLSRYYEQMKPYGKTALTIGYEKKSDVGIPVGSSKFGGCPDLPPDAEWFTNTDTGAQLSFVCQINCAQAKPFDRDDRLPARGMLYLFYDCGQNAMPWGFDPKDKSGAKVFYTEARISSLIRREAPAGALEFGAACISFGSEESLPDNVSYFAGQLDLTDDEQEALSRFVDGKTDAGKLNKLLGHSDNIQDGMELECAYVAEGIYCGGSDGYNEGKKRGLDKTAGEWSLLLQIDSNEDLGMMWGDEGRLYVWIREEDLKAKRFEDARLILQCY